MRIFITIITDLLIAAIALFTASEIFALKRFKSFTLPYTDKMIRLKIIEADQRESVLREDRLSHIAGILVSGGACCMMARYLAWPTGLIVFIVALAAALLFIHPDMEETTATREGYFRMHKNSMQPARYAEMVRSAEEKNTPN